MYSINVQGVRSILKRKAHVNTFNADFYFRQTHALKSDHKFWKSQWAHNVWMAYGTKTSTSVAIF